MRKVLPLIEIVNMICQCHVRKFPFLYSVTDPLDVDFLQMDQDNGSQNDTCHGLKAASNNISY